MAQSIIRWVLGIALMVVVWHHSHWSVALSLTLIFFALESTAFIVGFTLRKR